jgi:beta-phosphoglucomutase
MPSASHLIDAFDAILFDLDGTLVDTMSLHYEAYKQVLQDHGLQLAWADYIALVGPPASEVIGSFVTAAGGDPARFELRRLHDDKKAAFADILATRQPQRLPAADILDTAAGQVRCALVSSGNRHGVSAILQALGWSERFEVIVTGDDVANGKPDPEPYRLAATLMDIAPARCAVLEDTPAGLISARASGMTAFDVADLPFAA